MSTTVLKATWPDGSYSLHLTPTHFNAYLKNYRESFSTTQPGYTTNPGTGKVRLPPNHPATPRVLNALMSTSTGSLHVHVGAEDPFTKRPIPAATATLTPTPNAATRQRTITRKGHSHA